MNIDTRKLKETLTHAYHHTVPEDHFQRAAFSMRFPEILELTNKGFSFRQIAELLEQCGLKLRTSTVEQYFREHMIEKMEKCVQMMDEQIERILQLTKTTGNKVKTKEVVPETPASEQHTAAIEGLHCLELLPVKPLNPRADVPEEVYLDGQLEHPAIPGLMLSVDERLYGALLEIVGKNGETHFETVQEKAFRVKWMNPIPRTETASSKDFVKMDYSLFENVGMKKK